MSYRTAKEKYKIFLKTKKEELRKIYILNAVDLEIFGTDKDFYHDKSLISNL